MTVRDLLQLCIIALLIWQVSEYRNRYGGEWAKQERKRKEREARRRKRREGEEKKEKVFEGLTQQPVCEQCAAEVEMVRREQPPKIEQERGRPREVETDRHFCPRQVCRYYGWLGLGNIVSNGRPSGGQWRQLKCVVCEGYFQETIGTVFFGSSVVAADIVGR